jgi:hypothetical protein
MAGRRRQPRVVKTRPLAEHLSRVAVTTIVITAVVTALVAALATSRATAHVLSAGALAAIVAGAAATGVLVGWVDGLNSGALDVVTGAALLTCGPDCRSEPKADPWTPRSLWRTALMWGLVAGLWAAAGAALVAVALNGRPARWVAVFATLTGLAGLSGVVVGVTARHRGAHAVRAMASRPPAPVPLLRRAWRQVALPLAASQAVVNAGFAWVLFHDYGVHGGTGVAPLTRSVVLADVPTIVTLLSLIFHAVAAKWGAVDVLTRRVEPVAEVDTPSPTRVGWQTIVYVAALGIALGRLAGSLLPDAPTLPEVIVARGLFSFAMVFAVSGFGYVRGVTNAHADAAATESLAVAA